MRPPEIENSTEEERREYIKNTFGEDYFYNHRIIISNFRKKHGKTDHDAQ